MITGQKGRPEPLLADKLDHAKRGREGVRQYREADEVIAREIEVSRDAGNERLGEHLSAVTPLVLLGRRQAEVLGDVAVPNVDVMTLGAEEEGETPGAEWRGSEVADTGIERSPFKCPPADR